ncbi:hypothetical protein QUF56_11290 [Ureibacillus composti]|nr:hypothetical protein [Ureibacillus composti]
MKKNNKKIAFFAMMAIALFVVLAIMTYQNQWNQKQYFLDNFQRQFVELQGIITHEEKENWSHPELISNQLSLILDDLEYVMMSHSYPAKVLSEEEKFMFARIYGSLNQLPFNEIYHAAVWSKKDMEKVNIVNEALVKAELKMETTIHVDWDVFMNQCKILDKELQKLRSLQK